MAYWLAEQRTVQESDIVQRFDPRFWTVNFPRPMMAAVTTTAPDALRVDAVFYSGNELAGLIWDSVDQWSHPLLSYATDRDYGRVTLSFRWRSQGIMPLDAVNGPTLTIEGRDAAGHAKSWYVRLWNYAQGTAEDARITLAFATLKGGFLLPGEADPVYPRDIDRMFIALVPPAFNNSAARFASPAEGWVELSEIRCTGGGVGLETGDIMLPEHRLHIATGYDDCYNQTPERLLRQIRALGYRGAINHYVGMSHYFRLERVGADLYAGLGGGALNTPCARWHADFAGRARAMGYELICSLSYELFDAHCPADWKQRAAGGAPALTGWTPPSTLLSPAHGGAMAYLRAVAAAFADIMIAAGLPVRFQIGEPWWWIMADGRPCLYDAAATAALGALSVPIADMRAPLDGPQKAMLDKAGELLAASTAALGQAVRDRAGAAGAEILLLVYLPSVLDDAMPEARRANMPTGWARPAFDILQLEDYDWVTAGRHGATRAGIAAVTARLGYPLAEQHYFAGFVLNRPATAQWREIDHAAMEGLSRGTPVFVWALPQALRDGYTHFELEQEGEADMQPFDDIGFPIAIGRGAQVVTEFSTGIVTTLSGHERRNSDWADARMQYDVGPGIRSDADMAALIAFFRARRGAAVAFRFRDPFDHGSAGHGAARGPQDQILGTGDGVRTRFALIKSYGDAFPDGQQRRITRPVAGSVTVAVDGAAQAAGWVLAPGGIVDFAAPPAEGAVVSAGFLFDVPVRFAEDRLDVARATHGAGGADSVLLIEVRDAV